ncbi:hypothetical protein BSKO_05100 [Bryopsis sp. KO-2023]|nr:hypothetical protein BSKO_05100 [Bryopsis sp. KO-2023]
MTTPSRRLLEVFTKEDTPEPQTPLPPTATLAKLSAPHPQAGALRGEVSNTPIRFRHSFHDAKTPKLSQGFHGSDFGGSKTVNPSSRLGGDFETLTENVRGPQFETIQEERVGLDLVAEIDHPEDGVSEEGGFLEEEEVERHEFEQWIHQRAAKFGRSYDQMLEEMGEEAVAFAYQTKRQKEIMQEVEMEEKRKLLEDIEMCMPCEGPPSPVPSCVHPSSSSDITGCSVSPTSIRSLGSWPPFDIPEEPEYLFYDLENSQNGEQ